MKGPGAVLVMFGVPGLDFRGPCEQSGVMEGAPETGTKRRQEKLQSQAQKGKDSEFSVCEADTTYPPGTYMPRKGT